MSLWACDRSMWVSKDQKLRQRVTLVQWPSLWDSLCAALLRADLFSWHRHQTHERKNSKSKGKNPNLLIYVYVYTNFEENGKKINYSWSNVYSIRILYPITFLTCSEREGGRKETGLCLQEDEQHNCVALSVVWSLTRTAHSQDPDCAMHFQEQDVWGNLHRPPPRFWNLITFEHFTDTESMCAE